MQSVAEVLRALRHVCPEVCLVKDRQFRQILRLLQEQGESVPSSVESPYWVSRPLLQSLMVLEYDDLPNASEVLLIHSPEDWLDEGLTPGQVLRYFWRHLVRAKLQKQFTTHLPLLKSLPVAVQAEGRFVLEQDGLLHELTSESEFLCLFAAIWLELKTFEPEQLNYHFPNLANFDSQPFQDAVQLPQVLQNLKPEGSADAKDRVQQDWHAEVEPEPTPPEEAGDITEILQESSTARTRGNWVRVAILEQRRSRKSATPLPHVQAAREAIEQGLMLRLAPLMQWNTAQQKRWNEALLQLVEPASKGFWPRVARCLYDIQKIVTDLQGELSTVDPVAWAKSLGKRPLVRKLSRARSVILLRHLRTAERHLVRSQLIHDIREKMERLLEEEMATWENRIRTELEPVLRDVLNEVGLKPSNNVERVAQNKVIAELLDLVCFRGYLRMSDLRDAIARNQLKLSNLAGPGEFLIGDAILQADHRLAVELDGIYQSGEVYLRALQRGTALGFGTPLGRWLFKFVALPFGGAFMAVEFGKYVKHEVSKLSGFILKQFGLGPVTQEDFLGSLGGGAVSGAHHLTLHHGTPFSMTSLGIVFILGLFFLLLLHVPAFRQLLLQGLQQLWKGLRLLLMDVPSLIWNSAPVRFIRHNPLVRGFNKYCGTALWATLLVGVSLTIFVGDPIVTAWCCAASFVSLTLFCLTPTGRFWEDELADWFAALWRDLSINLVQGVLSWFLWLFQVIGNLIERWLYTVDEWLRFREGQSQGSLWLKVILALMWYPIAYLFRFSFYLLIEPQINPVKHFPVVTVGHKLILPLTPELSNLLGSPWLAGGIVSSVPGVFGFIAWELKENWRLYSANRTESLPRVALGHHGETMRGLLKPGFHSGTVPTLFEKLRKLLRKADRTNQPQPVGKAVHGLQEIEHAVELFVEREWLATLNQAGLHLEAGHPIIGVQQLVLEVHRGEAIYQLAFTHHAGTIRAAVLHDTLSSTLTSTEREVFLASVSGMCQMSCAEPPTGVERVTWNSWASFWDRSTPST